jgi:hypothetical protein
VKEPDQKRPRAFIYYWFLASLTSDSQGGWQRIDFLRDARRGDIIAWRFATIKTDENTGHVLFLAETPSVDNGGVFSVRVYDSAAEAHFEKDTRDSGKFPKGVGSGVIKFNVDGAGRPTSFVFAPPSLPPNEFTLVQTQ